MAAAGKAGDFNDNILNATGNWTPSLPIANDIVRLLTSTTAINDQMDAFVLITLDDLLVSEGLVNAMGSAAFPFEISSDTLTMQGGADTFHIKGDFPIVFAAPLRGTPNAFNLQGKSNGGNANIYASRGRTLLDGSFSMVNGWLLPSANDGVLRIDGITMTGDVHVDAGLLELNGTITGTLYVSGGGVVICESNAVLGPIQLSNGGTLQFNDGTIGGPVIVKGGHFDAHLHHDFEEITDPFTVIGTSSRVNLRTGTKSIEISGTKTAIANPQIILNDGESF